MSEICEIGEQGVSIVGSELLVSPLRVERESKLQLNLRLDNELPTKKVAFAMSIGRLSSLSRPDNWKVVTWLILPVVICLSQRLSHACLSINKFVL